VSETLRAFIALELPLEIKEALAGFQGALRQAGLDKGARWVRPEHIHLTLKFLGDVPASRIGALEEALREAAVNVAPFILDVKGLGRFPPRGPAKVLWVGLEGELKRLYELYSRLETKTTALGFAAETRPFKPHLTLARLRGGGELSDILEAHEEVVLGSFSAERLCLFRSDLSATGPRYTPLVQVRL
jgi:RNA 2',3'-cyclic 3'-phosphodiesterase